MSTTVFFSWQSDTPTREGRNLIDRALQQAARRLGEDTEIEEAIREISIDRDTKGVAGSPPIVDTIFRKIDKAAVFVPDLTFIGTRRDGRPTPNPNVLIEYGWALKSLGHARIVPLMNTAFGMPTDDAMPFNMRHLRHPIQYECSSGADDDARKKTEQILSTQLESAIRAVLASEDFKASLPQPPEPPPFQRREPRDGPGRFRARGEPLGVSFRRIPLAGAGHEIRLSDGPVIWLRLMPNVDPGKTWRVTEIGNAIAKKPILPIFDAYAGYNYLRADDGFGVYPASREDESTVSAIVAVFISGEIWAVDSYVLEAWCGDGKRIIPSDLEKYFRESLNHYTGFLMDLGISPPFRWILGMEDLKGRGLYVPDPSGQISIFPGPSGPCLLDVVTAEGLHSPGDPPAKSLKPFFARLYDSCGVERPEWLDR